MLLRLKNIKEGGVEKNVNVYSVVVRLKMGMFGTKKENQ